MNIPDLNKRVKEVIYNETDGNVSKFASIVGISQQKINRLFVVDTRTKKYPVVPSDVLVKISEMFVGVDLRWLLTGSGKRNEFEFTERPPPKASALEQLRKEISLKDKIIEKLEKAVEDKEEIIRMLKTKATRTDKTQKGRKSA